MGPLVPWTTISRLELAPPIAASEANKDLPLMNDVTLWTVGEMCAYIDDKMATDTAAVHNLGFIDPCVPIIGPVDSEETRAMLCVSVAPQPEINMRFCVTVARNGEPLGLVMSDLNKGNDAAACRYCVPTDDTRVTCLARLQPPVSAHASKQGTGEARFQAHFSVRPHLCMLRSLPPLSILQVSSGWRLSGSTFHLE